MKRIIFLGSKPIGYKCLEFLIKNQKSFDCDLIGVLANNNFRFGADSNLIELALKNNINTLKSLDDLFKIDNIDLIISVQYHEILKPYHIARAKKIAINLHMAPLPEYRGCNQFSFAIYNESKTFGTTIHQLEPGIDSGKIIAERRFEIPENCFVNELYDLTFKESVILFEENIGKIIDGDFQLIDQNDLINERGTKTYYRKDIEKIKKIDLGDIASEVSKKIRATSMPGFEPAYTIINNEKFYLIPSKFYSNHL